MAKLWFNNAWLFIINTENSSNWTYNCSVALATSKTLIGVDKGFLHIEHPTFFQWRSG
jgi:hypothetical protein